MGKVVERRKRHGLWGMRAQSRSAPIDGGWASRQVARLAHLVSTTAASRADKQAHRLVRRGPRNGRPAEGRLALYHVKRQRVGVNVHPVPMEHPLAVSFAQAMGPVGEISRAVAKNRG